MSTQEANNDDESAESDDRIAELEKKLDDLQFQLESQRQFSNMLIERLVPGAEIDDYTADPMQNLSTVDRVATRLEATEQAANDALHMARQVDNGARTDGNPSKVDIAARTARNELVRRAASGSTMNGASIENGEVREMCRPENDLKWQTVEDAFQRLTSEWEFFRIDESYSPKRLILEADKIEAAVVRAVEKDLGRDDLAKKLVGGDSNKGV